MKIISSLISLLLINILSSTSVWAFDSLLDGLKADKLDIKVEKKFALLDVGDGILSPILTNAVFTLEGALGTVEIDGTNVTSITQVPVVVNADGTPAPTPFNFRPTLYISFDGFNIASGEVAPWQEELSDSLASIHRDTANNIAQLAMQYRHWTVDWDSDENTYRQVKALASRVGRFLETRTYQWDVVLLGFSRGGIISAELGRKLVSHHKVRKVSAILLDPTPSPVFADHYPSYNNFANGKCYTYFDNRVFGVISNFTTVTDAPIPGCEKFNLHGPHEEVVDQWAEAYRDNDIMTIVNSNFENRTFAWDGLPDDEIVEVIVIRSKNEFLNMSVDVADGNFYNTLNGALGPITFSTDLAIGSDGLDTHMTAMVAYYGATINKDVIATTVSLPNSSYATRISEDGAYNNTSILILNESTLIGSGKVEVDITIGNANYSYTIKEEDIKDSLRDLGDSFDSAVNELEEAVKKIWKM